ncbi:MAG: hypothetical protein WGN25_13495 [Candidatus Electrothrix sp. GW3-4]|uniref:hypothetical protein n=1 Tax=Candidatus Electrothrix sp. GW3-4 TaxID=3126740 RepID=UPI0030D2A87E
MKQVLWVLLCLSLCSCMTTKIVGGGIVVNGTVADARTGRPLEGAEVFLRYLAQSNFGVHSKDGTPVHTDSMGRFLLPSEEIRLWGGWGPLTGYIKEWPEVHYRKAGYQPDGKAFMHPSLNTYRDMQLRLEPE